MKNLASGVLLLASVCAWSQGRRVAVVVGVSTYRTTDSANLAKFPDLQFAHLDAQRIAARLRELGWEVTERISEPGKDGATKALVLLTLQNLATQPEDTVLFFFSGNGCEASGSGYLAVSDSIMQAGQNGAPNRPLAGSMLGLGEVGQMLSKQSARKRILLLDISRKDRTMVMDNGAGPVAMRADMVAELARMTKSGPASWCLLSSCDKGEESFEDPDLMDKKGSGVFTAGLLEGLSAPASFDAQGQLRPDLMWGTTRDFVKKWCASAGRTMNPRWQADMLEPLSLGPRKGA